MMGERGEEKALNHFIMDGIKLVFAKVHIDVGYSSIVSKH